MLEADGGTAADRQTRHLEAIQIAWAATPLKNRLAVLRRVRPSLVEAAEGFLDDLAPRPRPQALVAELLPLADAIRFLEREAETLLRPRRLGAIGRPLWLSGHAAEVRRVPFGTVLVIGPDNYPLLLAGIQALQALVAGNAVQVKPAPGCTAPLARLGAILADAGLPPGLFTVLGEDVVAAKAALATADKVFLTGSAATGQAILANLAPRLTPATLELSGSDAVFVLDGADPDTVARALAFGVSLNGGATCIAPRRVFVPQGTAAALEDRLRRHLEPRPAVPVPGRVRRTLAPLLREAAAKGARFMPAPPDPDAVTMRPTAVLDADPNWGLLKADIFAPLLAIVPVADAAAAIEADAECPYALGASVFGPEAEAVALAGRIDAGTVTINDLIAPTADPRLPFGGARASGYGVTRGAEGLLEMTRPKVVTRRGGRFRPHYDPPDGRHLEAGLAYLRAAHGSGGRLKAWGRLLRALKALGSSSA